MLLQFISLYGIVFLIWLAFTGSLAIPELVVGLLVAAAVSIVLARYSNFRIGPDFPVRFFRFLLFIPFFIVEMVKANIDVARRVIDPALPIRPALVKVPTKLKGEISKLCLANSITLTPGTLAVDIVNDSILVHFIDKESEGVTEKRAGSGVIGEFEEKIRGVFE